ncbi:MAG: acyl-CoA desaturase [Gemmatimonadales bacterium]|jgi:linoleoyl-CoA desaturase|nr:MAG: acyl-CoA desaturase [Gemmatimonadales bacterium]
MSTIRVTFPSRDAASFSDDVKSRVSDYFTSRGISDKADWRMVLKGLILLAVTFVPYGMILSNNFGPWTMLGLALVMGVGVAGIGFSISHDALHGAYSNTPWVNRVIGWSFDMCGANGYMWKVTHNVIHHTYTNIEGLDEDLTVSPLLRLSPHTEWKPFHRFQHLYGFLAYSFSTLFWVFVKDYKYFLQKDIGPFLDRKNPPKEVAGLLIGKAFYYTWAIVIPLLVVNVTWWQFAIGFVAMNLVAGTILGVVFQLAHVVEDITYPTPDAAGAMGSAWMQHEMETTSDFGPKNRLLCWYVGGLNFQVEHHLFPKVCSIHYPAISEIVKESALAHGLPYNQHLTLREAMASHYRSLKRLSIEPLAAAA